MNARKKNKAPHKPKDTWLITYSDFMTALFAFFVMMFAMSDIDEAFFQEVALAAAGTQAVSILDFGGAAMDDILSSGILELPGIDMGIFDAPVIGQGPGEGPGVGGDVPGQVETAFEILVSYFAELVAAGQIEQGALVAVVDPEEGWISISLYGDPHRDVYFATGSAVLTPAALEVLEFVGNIIADLEGIRVSVEGHTDNVPISTAQFPSNWELSGARASAVVRHFVYNMRVIDGDMISALGRGEYDPIATNLTEEGRARNRRVVITLYEQVVLDVQ